MESQVYTVQDIQSILGLSKTKAYEYIRKVYSEKKPFRVIKAGSSYRIPKQSFDRWLNQDVE